MPTMPVASGTARGSFELDRDQSEWAATWAAIDPGFGQGDRRWDGMPIPSRGVLRLNTTVEGELPREASLSVAGVSRFFTFPAGAEAAAAVSLGDGCIVPQCEPVGELHVSPSTSWADEVRGPWRITVEWQLELAMGTTAEGEDLQVTVTE